MKETYYFSHDYNARNNEKILKLVKNEGWGGYGIYWAIIEKLYEADGFLEEDYDCIAFDLRTKCERIKRIINDYKLFKIASKKICSKSVLARLRKRKGKSEKARQSANIRWNKMNNSNANALRTLSERNALKQSKVKQSKIKENKEKKQPEDCDTNKIFDLFYQINPSINYGNKTQRGAVQWLSGKFGFKNVVAMATKVIAVQGEKYAPVVTTPLQMKNKIAELKIYFDKEDSTIPTI